MAIENKPENPVLAPDEEEMRTTMLRLFKRELNFMRHRGIRTRLLRDFNESQIEAFKDIFENCSEKINFIRDESGTLVGWDLKNDPLPCSEQE